MPWEIVRYKQDPEEERKGREQMEKIIKELEQNRVMQARLRMFKENWPTEGQIAGEGQTKDQEYFGADMDDGAYIPKEVYEEMYRRIRQSYFCSGSCPKEVAGELDALQEEVDRLRDLFAEVKGIEGVIR